MGVHRPDGGEGRREILSGDLLRSEHAEHLSNSAAIQVAIAAEGAWRVHVNDSATWRGLAAYA